MSLLDRLSLTARILLVNILPLAVLGGGIFYLDSYRAQLLDERYKLARIEAQITAEALAGASRARQEALLVQIGKEQGMRLRMFDAEGRLWADSFALDEPGFTLDDPTDDSFGPRFARFLDQMVDTLVSAQPVPKYDEPESVVASAWPELVAAASLLHRNKSIVTVIGENLLPGRDVGDIFTGRSTSASLTSAFP